LLISDSSGDLDAEVSVPIDGANPRALRRSVLHACASSATWVGEAVASRAAETAFPLANESDFDWRLIGARRGMCMVDEDEQQGVWHAGQLYTRRELAEQQRKELARAAKYSRGARSTDPPVDRRGRRGRLPLRYARGAGQGRTAARGAGGPAGRRRVGGAAVAVVS
jgi:hypothetical protein